MTILRIIFNLAVGVVFGVGVALALSPALAVVMESWGVGPSFATITAVAVLCAFAPTIRRAFGRGFLALGAARFVLPLSALLLSGSVFSETVTAAPADQQAAAAVGAGLAGGMFTAAAGFIGFILGAVFLIAGLILSLGGRREVVVR